jgi:exopolysaccharide production protein ExoQ
MPPIVASLVYLGFVAWLFRRDFREKPNVTGALWLPTIWLFIMGSRTVSQWLAMLGISSGESSVEEGSPLDAVVYFLLIVMGAYVLAKRRITFSEVFQRNPLLIAFLAYCFISILWSDFPLVSLKRWIKILGHPIMALVLFSEPDPKEAFIRMAKRCAFVIIPVSVLFIKYYPQWGRGYDLWSGMPHDMGITMDKNALGYDCLIFGSILFWHFLNVRQQEKSRARRDELVFCFVFLGIICWLMKHAQSSTSLVSLVLAVTIVAVLGLRAINKRMVGTYMVMGIVFCVLGQILFNLSDVIIESLGKDPTLTDRTLVWQAVLKVPLNPLIGAGFEDFWLGDRVQELWTKFWWHPNQAHNGYLETYLNLGLIGLGFMLFLMIATFQKSCRMLLVDFEFARFRLGFLAAFVVYNWTEAAFKALHPLWFVFYIIAIDMPKTEVVPAETIGQSEGGDADFQRKHFEEDRALLR